MYIPICHQTADAAGGYNLPIQQKRLHDLQIETKYTTELAQPVHVTFTAFPQGKIVAYPQLLKMQMVVDQGEKLGRRHSGDGWSESESDDLVHAQVA